MTAVFSPTSLVMYCNPNCSMSSIPLLQLRSSYASLCQLQNSAKSLLGVSRRFKLQADESLISRIRNRSKHVCVIDLAGARFVTARHVRHVKVSDLRNVFRDVLNHVPF